MVVYGSIWYMVHRSSMVDLCLITRRNSLHPIFVTATYFEIDHVQAKVTILYFLSTPYKNHHKMWNFVVYQKQKNLDVENSCIISPEKERYFMVDSMRFYSQILFVKICGLLSLWFTVPIKIKASTACYTECEAILL